MTEEEIAITVLNADDDEIGRYAKSRLLRQAGYTVLEAPGGAETLRLARQKPNLIVLDVNLPDINGLEVCHRLKEDPATEVIPILLISATYVDSHWYVAGLESGADGYLTEPVEPTVFLATVRALLRAQQAEAALRQARDELEVRVAERTAALAEANRALQAEIRERERAEADARRRAAHAEALARVAACFGARLELEQVLQVVCEETARLFDFPAAVALYDEALQAYYPAAGHGLPAELQEELLPLPLEAHRRYREQFGRVRFVPGRELSGLSPKALYIGAGLRPIASIDMDREGRTIGILNVLVQGGARPFGEEELELLKGISDQAVLALNNAYLFERVQAGQERLRQLAQRLVSVQEEERRHLAQELHDDAGQALTSLKISLSLLRNDLLSQPADTGPAAHRLEDAIEVTDGVINQVRLLSHGLSPFNIEVVSLEEGLRSLCQEFETRTQLPVHYRSQELPPLPQLARLSFYRFLQEALTNIARHADARKVQVSLAAGQEAVSLSVADDGRGFDTSIVAAAPERSRGMGLLSIRERFVLLGGEVEIASTPGEGTHLTARFPL